MRMVVVLARQTANQPAATVRCSLAMPEARSGSRVGARRNLAWVQVRLAVGRVALQSAIDIEALVAEACRKASISTCE